MIPLNQIQVAEPCHEPWDSMQGGDNFRNCTRLPPECLQLRGHEPRRDSAANRGEGRAALRAALPSKRWHTDYAQLPRRLFRRCESVSSSCSRGESA